LVIAYSLFAISIIKKGKLEKKLFIPYASFDALNHAHVASP
jgi:hypothetical protein